jgi:hypothetical protein
MPALAPVLKPSRHANPQNGTSSNPADALIFIGASVDVLTDIATGKDPGEALAQELTKGILALGGVGNSPEQIITLAKP